MVCVWQMLTNHILQVSKEMCDESVQYVMGEVITGSHSGRKNRKKCPIVEPEPFQKLEPEIKELLQIYKLSTTTTWIL